jgi:hypothetical protein
MPWTLLHPKQLAPHTCTPRLMRFHCHLQPANSSLVIMLPVLLMMHL